MKTSHTIAAIACGFGLAVMQYVYIDKPQIESTPVYIESPVNLHPPAIEMPPMHVEPISEVHKVEVPKPQEIVQNDLEVTDYLLDNLDYNTTREDATHNLFRFIHDLALVESDMQPLAKNPKSTAKGYLQYTDEAFEVAKKRMARMYTPTWLSITDVTKLNLLELSQLFWGDLYQRKGTTAYITLIMDGNIWAMKKVYCRIHHTDCGPKEMKRLNKTFVLSHYKQP